MTDPNCGQCGGRGFYLRRLTDNHATPCECFYRPVVKPGRPTKVTRLKRDEQ